MTLTQAFLQQAESCKRLDSPFMARLFKIFTEYWPKHSYLSSYFESFEGDIGPNGASLPLRIAGGLHALTLSGRSPELAAHYPPHDTTDPALTGAVLSALETQEAFLLDWVTSPPQTNEVRRSAALMAGAAVIAQHWDHPIYLSELGASAGLNLFWDKYALDVAGARLGNATPVLTLRPTWDGPPPPRDLPRIADRAGVDLNPLDASNTQDRLRLMAYLWPDQPHRLDLTRAAASVANISVDRGDAIDWLKKRLHSPPDGHIHLIQHTVAWQYFPPEKQAEGKSLIEVAGARATMDRPLAWLSMEADGSAHGETGALLRLRMWPGDVQYDLARVDFHGRWINWKGPS